MTPVLLVLLACGGPESPVDPEPVAAVATAESEPTAEPEPTAESEPPPAPEPTLPPAPSEPAADATGLAEQIALVESTLRDPTWEGPGLDAYGHLQQRIYRILAIDEPLFEEVRQLIPQEHLGTFVDNRWATYYAMGTVKVHDDLPAWRVVEPAPASELLGYYQLAEEAYGVPWEVLAAIHLVETRMGRLRGLSVAGAQGPMQFMPATWEQYGEGDVEDDRDAILAAGRYLKAMGAEVDLAGALWAYNHSRKYVRSVQRYARVMEANPRAYLGYHGWEVYYLTVRGSIWLAPGYHEEQRVQVDSWCDRTGTCPR